MVQRLICKDALSLIRNAQKVDILCIGAPNITGDAVGPVTGYRLKHMNLPKHVNVIGCIKDPVHGRNLRDKLQLLRDDALVICVDAAIGEDYPLIKLRTGPMQPGAAISDKLPMVGDVSVLCMMGDNLQSIIDCEPSLMYHMSREVVKLLSACLDLHYII